MRELARALVASHDRYCAVHFPNSVRMDFDTMQPRFQRIWLAQAETALAHLASWPHDALDVPTDPRTTGASR